MDDFEEDNSHIAAWLAARPTLTEERSHPNHWFNRGADLHASAGAMWYAMENDARQQIAQELGFSSGYSIGVACYPVYHMMCGLALEVIMKAVLVQRGLPFPKTHSLERLVQAIGLTKTKDELEVLKFYEQSVLWAGRYPVPLNCTDDKLKEYWSLAGDVLTSPVKLSKSSSLQMRTRNGSTKWENFSPVWLEIAAMFKHR
jgi:hypothetical protein